MHYLVGKWRGCTWRSSVCQQQSFKTKALPAWFIQKRCCCIKLCIAIIIWIHRSQHLCVLVTLDGMYLMCEYNFFIAYQEEFHDLTWTYIQRTDTQLGLGKMTQNICRQYTESLKKVYFFFFFTCLDLKIGRNWKHFKFNSMAT